MNKYAKWLSSLGIVLSLVLALICFDVYSKYTFIHGLKDLVSSTLISDGGNGDNKNSSAREETDQLNDVSPQSSENSDSADIVQEYDYDPKDIAGEYCRNDGACLTISATEGNGFTDTGDYVRNDITLDVSGIGYGNPIPSGATTDTLGYFTQDSLLSNLTFVPLIGSYTFTCDSCDPNTIYKRSGDGTPSVGITIVTQPIILFKVFASHTGPLLWPDIAMDSSNPPRQHAAYVFILRWDDGMHQPNIVSDDTVFYQYR